MIGEKNITIFFFFEREQVIHCIKKKVYNRKDNRGADPKGPNLQAQEQQTLTTKHNIYTSQLCN